MGDIISSYEFHRRIESPVAFVRREWAALLLFGGAFSVLMLVGVLALDPAFFYPRFSTDPLLYYLKGLSFAQTGRAEAVIAVNLPALHYVSMPGILRSPVFLAFDDFDTRLRAIQVGNIFLVAATATMYAYILSWGIARAWHWVAVGFSFSFVLLSPWWITNVLAPLGDAPYAFFSAAACIIVARVLASDARLRDNWPVVVLGAFCFAVAFLVRFTAPALLVLAGLLAAGRGVFHGLSRRRMIVGASCSTVVLLTMIALNWEVLSDRYLGESLYFLREADKSSMVLNLVALALPSQIVPVFQLGFAQPPMESIFYLVFGTTPRDRAWTAIGIAIACVVFFGMWRTRARLLPEIAYLICVLPVLTLIIPSTSRYLMAYQPFIWMFFLAGLSFLLSPFRSRLSARHMHVASAMAVFAVVGMGVMRARRIAGTQYRNSASVSVIEARSYAADVASTFRQLRRFLETLPRERSLLIGARGTTGRWKAISDIDYYFPDSSLAAAVVQKDVYLLAECGTREDCLDDVAWETSAKLPLGDFGDFAYERVFVRSTRHTRAAVYRVHLKE
ncbi:MAG: hypothetical protein H0T48_11915 [Gemmatimonadaceae bacterium]|nr:hypothetical protein [Gemmatimonadaceae bacterium]